jgi:regulator of protease activity HflC (stomatin/prohibitin superfamily)
MWIVLGILYSILTILGIILIFSKVSIDTKNLWNWGWIIISSEILYLFLSFRVIGPQEIAAFLFFGKPLYALRSGLVFVPFGICSLFKATKLTTQIQIPGDPEQVDKSGNDDQPLAGKVRPIRAPTGSSETVSGEFVEELQGFRDDPINKRMTLEVSAQIRFRINNIISFVENIGSIEEVDKQMRDTAESTIKVEFAKRTPCLILAHLSDINNTLNEAINKLVGKSGDENSWGVEVENVQIVDIDLSKTVNTAMVNTTAAAFDKKTIITKAEAEEAKRAKEGAGAADAELSMLTAEALGFEQLASVAKTRAGQIAMQIRLATEALQNSQYSIVEPGIAGLAAGAQETLRKIFDRNKSNVVKDAPAKTVVKP